MFTIFTISSLKNSNIIKQIPLMTWFQIKLIKSYHVKSFKFKEILQMALEQ